MTSPTPWRTGRKVGRTIYSGEGDDGVLIGVMDTREDADLVVRAVEAHTAGAVSSSVPEQVWVAGMDAVRAEPRSAAENARTWRVVCAAMPAEGSGRGLL